MAVDNKKSKEHILLCLSPSPEGERVIDAAANLAQSIDAQITAVFVQTPEYDIFTKEQKEQLLKNRKMAEQIGAKVITLYGGSISVQISQYASISGVTKIVMEYVYENKKYFFKRQSLLDSLSSNLPEVEFYMIPCTQEKIGVLPYHSLKRKPKQIVDVLWTLGILATATLIAVFFFYIGMREANIITLYILAVLLIALMTERQICSLVGSLLSVLIFNLFFTEPYLTLDVDEPSYLITFFIMFLSGFITAALTKMVKRFAGQEAERAYRTEVLLETSQKLQAVDGQNKIFEVLAEQLQKLLNQDVIFYKGNPSDEKQEVLYFSTKDSYEKKLISEKERRVAAWAYENRRKAGATTNQFPDSDGFYIPLAGREVIFAIVGIRIEQNEMERLQRDILHAILNEGLLVLEKEQFERDKNKTMIKMKQEKLRTDLLRAISHDLRTPLTSISGNAGILISNSDRISREEKKQLYTDIQEDALWLINLVENLLSVTRIENGTMQINKQPELLDDVVNEALQHIKYNLKEYHLTVQQEDEFLMAQMDARLIIQVIVNLIDNAIKYTPPGSDIILCIKKEEKEIAVEVADNGEGISDEAKSKIFDMFYTANKGIVDSRRSMGLGLALCKSIMSAHGGRITVKDNIPHGAIFTFYLAAEEVTMQL